MNRTLSLLVLVGASLFTQAFGHNNPPQFLGAPDALRAVNNRGITMVSSIAVTPGGRLWATWYAGQTPGEDHNNYVVLATSADGGKTWREVLVADPDASGPVRTFDPEIWIAPNGSLYWIWAQTVGHKGELSGTWVLEITNPEEDAPAYDAPRRWHDGVMMCKPIILADGTWALPISTWDRKDNSAQIVVSSDEGKSWHVRGAANVPQGDRSFDEHMIVERKDGTLWMLVRTRYGIGESVSADGGKTWTQVADSAIPHPSSRFFIYRLDSGNLLLVKHGPMDAKTGRSHLTAFVSEDDGKTWQGGLLLDERGAISYPDGQQAADGTIYVTYDRSRTDEREILFATFREQDALAGKDTSGQVRLRQLISKGSGGVSRNAVPDSERNANADGTALRKAPSASVEPAYEAIALARGVLLFSDRTYLLSEVPDVLQGFALLQTPLNGTKTIECKTDGMLYFLTPAPDRNKDSQEALLLQQGFEKVALPEVLTFGAKSNLCTLYQKQCKAGEKIRFGKWAIPLIFTQPEK